MSAFETLAQGNDILCDPCENEGCYTIAEGYCTDCNDFLCSECLKVHRRPVLWRHHQILKREEIPKVKASEEVHDACVEPCQKHRSKILEYFCRTHNELACSLCMFRSHRFCEGVNYIPDMAKSFINSKEVKDLKEECSCLLNDIEAYKKLTERGISEVNEMKKNAAEKVTKMKDEICNFLEKVMKGISTMNRADISNIKASNMCFKRVAKQLKRSVTVLEKKERENKMSQLFVTTKLFKMNLKEMQDEVEESKKHCTIQHYEVAVNEDNFMEIQRCLEKMLKFDVHKSFPLNQRESHFTRKGTAEMYETDSMTLPAFENLQKRTDGTALLQNQEEAKRNQSKHSHEDPIADKNLEDKVGNTATEYKGVWSPSNPYGIRQYDRDFLMKLQTSLYALHKPIGILDIPGIVFDQVAKLEGPSEITQTSGVSMKTIKHVLYEYIVKGTADNLGVIAWINSNVDESVTSGKSFIRAVMTAVCKQSLEKDDEDECMFDVEKIRGRGDLLVKYLKHNPDIELQALYALQVFVGKRKHPPGNIRDILHVLYEANIISEDGFFKWETSEEMEECQEMFLKQTVPFFFWLLTKDKQ